MNLKSVIAVVGSVAIASAATVAVAGSHSYSRPAPKRVVSLDRNQNGYWPKADWFKRITLSGEINVDATAGDRMATRANRFAPNSHTDIALANANIYLEADVNRMTRVNIDLQDGDNFEGNTTVRPGIHSIHNQPTRYNNLFDEAYITIADFHKSPWYLRAGREYVRFGHYDRHPITAPFTQLLSQTKATAVELGVIDVRGFNGSVFAFSGLPRVFTTNIKRRINNGGVQIGYARQARNWSFSLDGSWLHNMTDVDYINSGIGATYNRTVGAISLDAAGHYKKFDGNAHYVAATRRFSAADYAYQGRGARPNAWAVELGYNFPFKGYKTRLSGSYQRSERASGLGGGAIANLSGDGLPRERWQADWTIHDVFARNTFVGLEYVYDDDYSATRGGTGRSSTTGIVRLGVRFA